jgi:hypothetical protein
MRSLEEAPVEVINLDREQAELYHQEFVVFRDVYGGVHQAEHPVIIDGLQVGSGGIVNAENNPNLKIGLDGYIEEMSFEDYLFMLGIKYGHYYKVAKDPKNDGADPNDLIKQLHQEIIEKRTEDTKRLGRGYDAARSQQGNRTSRTKLGNEGSERTTNEDGQFFVKMFKDLGIDGLDAELALPRDDIKDEVDEYIVIDPKAYETEGEEEGKKIYIGVQRTFRDKGLRNRFLLSPEGLDKGIIFKTMLREESDIYNDENKDSLWQKLLLSRVAKAREEGISPLAYAEKHPNDGISPVSEVLRGGQREHIRRVVGILQEIQKQIQTIFEQPDHEYHGLPPHWQEQFKARFSNLPIQNIIDELTGN